MKKHAAFIVTLAILATLVLPAFLKGQKTTPEKSPKGKAATSRDFGLKTSPMRKRPATDGLSQSAMIGSNLPAALFSSPQRPEPRYVPDQILVQLESRQETARRLGLGSNFKLAQERNESLKSDAVREAQAIHLNVARTLSMKDPRQGDVLILNLPADISVDQAILEFEKKPGFKFAQKNWIYDLQQTPNDVEYTSGFLWGMLSDDLPTPIGPAASKNDFGCHAEKAWFAGHIGSRSVYVGVIDGGVQAEHQDLINNIWLNKGETGMDAAGNDKATNGADDDGTGLPDDVRGWDFLNGDGSTFDGDIQDQHGTHVAGTIGALGNNTIGVVGVNWEVTIIPAKIFGATQATSDKAVEAIDYFIRLKRQGLNIVAINNSWGGFAYDLLLLEAIKRAAREGILFIAAAGNYRSDNDLTPFYPASYDTRIDTISEGGTEGVFYDGVISVAALQSDGTIAPFSHYGLTSVDLGAPGARIISTVPLHEYGLCDGTSMAAPHVTGAIALYASTNSGVSAPKLRDAILRTVTGTPSLVGKTATGGRLTVSTF